MGVASGWVRSFVEVFIVFDDDLVVDVGGGGRYFCGCCGDGSISLVYCEKLFRR